MKLENIGREIELAITNLDEPGLGTGRSAYKFVEERAIPFDQIEQQIQDNLVAVQTETAKRVLKRFYKK